MVIKLIVFGIINFYNTIAALTPSLQAIQQKYVNLLHDSVHVHCEKK